MIRYNWLVYYLHDKALTANLNRYARGKLIDIGCGRKPHDYVYAVHVNYCVGVDHKESLQAVSRVVVAAKVYAVPVKDEAFN